LEGKEIIVGRSYEKVFLKIGVRSEGVMDNESGKMTGTRRIGTYHLLIRNEDIPTTFKLSQPLISFYQILKHLLDKLKSPSRLFVTV